MTARRAVLARVGRALTLLALSATIGLVALAALLLSDGYRPVVIATGSMGDAAPPQSIVVAAPRDADAVAVGDILVMQRPGRATVTHRVIELEPGPNGQLLAITQGDANEAPDADPYRLDGSELVGRWVVPSGGAALTKLGEPTTALAVILFAVSAVSFLLLRWIWVGSRTAATSDEPFAVPPSRHRRRGQIAVAVATLLGVMFGGVAWSLFASTDTVSGNQFNTAECFDAQVSGVQHGVTKNAAEGVQTVVVSAVDPTRTVLYTSVRNAGAEPADATVLAVLAGPTSIEFTRNTDAAVAPDIDIAWTLVEYSCGVDVQRGTVAGNDASILDIAVATMDPAASFVVTSSVSDRADSAHDGDDDHLGIVLDATTVRLRSASGGSLPSDHTYAWQVVTYADPADVSVQIESATLSATDSTTVTLADPVDPATTLVLAHTASSGSGTAIGNRQVRAHLSSSTTVELTRLVSGGPLEVTLQVVTFTDGTVVQHGVLNLGIGEASTTVALNPVDLSRASAISTVNTPGSQSGGATTATDPSVLGESAATFTFLDSMTLTVTREATTAAASFGWQVVEWGGPSWWDTDYPFRQRIDVDTTTSSTPDGYSVPVTIDHTNLINAGLSVPSGDDLRVLRWDGAAWIPLHRVLQEDSAWDSASTTFWFRTDRAIEADATDSYWLYFGNPSPGAPLADPEFVWLLDETFESGTLGDFEDRTGGTNWYTADSWTSRIPLTIQASEVDQDLLDFPVLVRLTDAALGTGAQADGDDIRFALPDGTALAHEIETWDPGTGALAAWVSVPNVSSTIDTTVYLYYGAPNAPNQQDPTSVWGGFEGVWHLQRDPSGAAPQVDGATANRHDGLSGGAMSVADLVTGVAGSAIDFDGGDDILAIEPFDPAASFLTVSTWVNLDALASDTVLLAQANTASSRRYEFGITAAGAIRLRLQLDGATQEYAAGTVPTGAWHHVAATWDGTTIRLFLDGSQVGSQNAAGTFDPAPGTAVSIGNVPTADRGVDGRIDEVRLSTTSRPVAWIAASQRNQAAGSTFVQTGATEAGSWFGQGTWSYRSPIGLTIDPGAGPLSDFTLLVEVVAPELVGATQANGEDLVFTADDGTTRLDHHVERFDSGTGALTAWVRVPTLAAGTELFVYYGNPGAADQQDPEGVFGPDADLILHGS